MQQAPKTIYLKRADYETIVNEAKIQAPLEACGLVAGIDEGEQIRRICKVYVLKNTDQSAEHFSLDPKEQLEAVKDMRRRGLTPLGNWHSHPATLSRPSEEDKRLAFDKNASYLILSLAGEEPVLNAFHIENGNSRTEHLEIIE